MRNLLIGCLIFMATTAAAATDIVATYKYEDGNMVTIVTRDSQHVRMDTSPTSYMLLQEDKVYSVSKDENDQWMVMDMDQLKAVTSTDFMSLFGGGTTETKKEEPYTATYEKTWQREKIAGYTGVIYNLEVKQGNQIVRRDEVVLGTHSDLKKVNKAWVAISAKMGEILGDEMAQSVEKATKEANEAGYGGMLRYGDEMILHSLRKMNLNLSYYRVPPEAQYVNMGQMPSQTQGGTPQDQQQGGTSSQDTNSEIPSDLDNLPDLDTETTGEGIPENGEAEKQKKEKTSEEALEESVNNLLKSIFN